MKKNMLHKIFFALLGLSLSALFAQQVQVSGTVKDDSTDAAVSGAVVVLSRAGLSDTTDAQGAFVLSGSVASVSGAFAGPGPVISGAGQLLFSLEATRDVSVTVRSLNGKTLYHVDRRLGPGRYEVRLPVRERGVILYELRIGTVSRLLKQVNLDAGFTGEAVFTRAVLPAARSLRKQAQAVDNLVVTHPDYAVASMDIDNYQSSGLEIRLTPKDTGFVLPDPDNTPPATDKPVKVFIMSGQSNMVGFGKINSSRGGVRWDPKKMFQAAAPDTAKGGIVSIYSGAYSPTADYDNLTPIETHTVTALGGSNSDPFPGGGTRVLRGYMQAPGTGLYIFKPGYGGSTVNIMVVNGTEVHRKEVGGEAVYTPMQLTDGERYSYKVTYLTNDANGLGWTEQVDPMPGTLEMITSPEGGGMFPQLVDDNGEWTVRNDVYYRGVVSAIGDGPLKPGFGAASGNFGPELGFGHVMGHYFDEPVLLIKTSIGNRSLSWDIAPPNTERFEYEGRTYAGYGDSINSWPSDQTYEWYRDNGCLPENGGKGYNTTTGNCFVPWYCGFEYDRFFDSADEVLADFENHYPQWKDQGYEIAGFVWWQGHKDQGLPHGPRYEINMANLIRVLRERWKLPNMPVVLATVAFDGGWNGSDNQKTIAEGQLAMNDWVKYPDFSGSVKCIEARDYWRDAEVSPSSTGYHYNHNAETYYKVGHTLGVAMTELLKK